MKTRTSFIVAVLTLLVASASQGQSTLDWNKSLRSGSELRSDNGQYVARLEGNGSFIIKRVRDGSVHKIFGPDPKPNSAKNGYFILHHTGPKLVMFRGGKYDAANIPWETKDVSAARSEIFAKRRQIADYAFKLNDRGQIALIDKKGNNREVWHLNDAFALNLAGTWYSDDGDVVKITQNGNTVTLYDKDNAKTWAGPIDAAGQLTLKYAAKISDDVVAQLFQKRLAKETRRAKFVAGRQSDDSIQFFYDDGRLNYTWTRPNVIALSGEQLRRTEGDKTYRSVAFPKQSPVKQIYSALDASLQRPNLDLTTTFALAEAASGQRYLHVDLRGSQLNASSDGKLYLDEKRHRGWYLEKLTVSIEPLGDSQLKLIDRGAFTSNADGAVTSSSGISLSTGGSLSSDPSASFSAGASFGNSYTESLQGFGVRNTSSGDKLVNSIVMTASSASKVEALGVTDGGLVAYKEPKDLIRLDTAGQFGGTPLNHPLPRAISGMPLMTQGVWAAPKGYSGDEHIQIVLTYTLRRVKVENKGFSYKYTAPSDVFTRVLEYKVPFGELNAQ